MATKRRYNFEAFDPLGDVDSDQPLFVSTVEDSSSGSGTKPEKKKGRYSNLTEEEKGIILDEVEPYKDILYSKNSGNITQARKRTIYTTIIDTLRAQGIILAEHSVPYFRDRVLDNIKSRALGKIKESMKSGSGWVTFSRVEKKAIDIFNLKCPPGLPIVDKSCPDEDAGSALSGEDLPAGGKEMLDVPIIRISQAYSEAPAEHQTSPVTARPVRRRGAEFRSAEPRQRTRRDDIAETKSLENVDLEEQQAWADETGIETARLDLEIAQLKRTRLQLEKDIVQGKVEMARVELEMAKNKVLHEAREQKALEAFNRERRHYELQVLRQSLGLPIVDFDPAPPTD